MRRKLEIVKPNGQPLEDFEFIWANYPRRVSKGQAYRTWVKTESIRPPVEEILAAIERNLKSGRWDEGEPQFIPHLSTWLNAWGWADE
mgnify:CR=1 FL=1